MPRINVETPIFFKCKQECSNCCKTNGGLVIIKDDDIRPISRYLKISRQEFVKKYTRKEGSRTCLIDKNGTECVFLENHKCLIYPLRPLQCKTFPFWPQNLKNTKRWHIIMDECPGIGQGKSYNRREIENVFNGKPVNSLK